MMDRIFSVMELLERNPEMGCPGRIATSRELTLSSLPLVLAYRLRRNKIEILAPLDGARKWPATF
jgi:toxin ParE1/3/4